MDPKSSAQLDPKLQEAYNRVMGTDTSTPTSTTANTPADGNPTTTAIPAPSMPNVTVDAAQPASAAPTPPTVDPTTVATPPVMDPATVPVTPVVQPEMTAVENTASVQPQTFSAKKGMKISPVILIVGAVVFLIIYTLVWVKVFGLQLPFLPQ